MRRFASLPLATALVVLLAVASAFPAYAERLRLATTTSTENSGLLAHLAPIFTAATGIEPEVVAVGTGQALELGRRGDVDALLVHHRAGEETFVREGYGEDRRDVMFNDFVIVGPAADPAGIRDARKATDALAAIAASDSPFLSRGDDSGTHRKELELWAAAPATREYPNYRETGAGMGRTLNIAVQIDAYTLTDRGTWLAFDNKRDHVVLLQTDPPLNNPYSSILVTSPLLPPQNRVAARAWHEWLTSPAGQAAIAAYRIDGQQLFFPAAAATPASN